jgi:hypothetical protein
MYGSQYHNGNAVTDPVTPAMAAVPAHWLISRTLCHESAVFPGEGNSNSDPCSAMWRMTTNTWPSQEIGDYDLSHALHRSGRSEYIRYDRYPQMKDIWNTVLPRKRYTMT